MLFPATQPKSTVRATSVSVSRWSDRPAVTGPNGSGKSTRGTLVLVSHDRRLLESVRLTHLLDLGERPPRLRRSGSPRG